MNQIYPGPTAIDRMETGFLELVRDVNSASVAACNAWIFFMALIAYFFITLAGVTHRDLLLATPVKLPVLNADIWLAGFFTFGPLLLVLIHFGLLLQHAMLAHKVLDLHARLARFEGAGNFRMHRIRMQVHAYFYSQLIAGPYRSKLFAQFLSVMSWGSLIVLPIVLLLDFQVTFLPFHDLSITSAHRICLLADLALIAIFGVCMRYPGLSFVSGLSAIIAGRPWSVAASAALGLGAMFFAFAVATIPDETMDRLMSAIPGARSTVPVGETDSARQRVAFWPTAVLFEGEIDFLSGRRASFFSRNLVVTDADLVRDSQAGPDKTSISLRRRDLRYGTFARSNLRQADLSGALLTKACLRETNLIDAKMAMANLEGADLWRAQFIDETSTGRPVNGANLRGADLRRADFNQVNLKGANLSGALLAGAHLKGALIDSENAEEARRQGANF